MRTDLWPRHGRSSSVLWSIPVGVYDACDRRAQRRSDSSAFMSLRRVACAGLRAPSMATCTAGCIVAEAPALLQ